MNIKVFNLMSGINETILTVQLESSECKFGLNKSVCNSKSKWNPNMNVAEKYSEPCQTYKMGFQPLTIFAKRSILDI